MYKSKLWLFIFTLGIGLTVFFWKKGLFRNMLISQCNETSIGVYATPQPKLTSNVINSNLKNAIKIAKDKGFTVISPELYEDDFDNYDFNVLIGMCSGSADGYCKSALFFNKDKFIGADSEIESSQVNTTWRNDNTIALSYTLYNDSDPFCCPTGGAKIVRFEYDGLVIKPLETIPATNGSAHR